MSPMMIGIGLGFAAGVAQFVALQKVAKNLVAGPNAQNAAQKSRVLSMVAWLDLALLPAIGGLIGMMTTTGGFAP